METKSQKNVDATLIINHECDATRDVVFDAFANAEALAEWWGPKGFPITVVKFNFATNGMFLYKAGQGDQTMWGRFIYKQIQRPELLEFVNSFTNKDGEIIRAPFSNVWPLEIFNQLTFTENKGKTKIVLKGYPLNATPEETQAFIAARANVEEGFKGTLKQLDEYLSTH